MRHKNVIFSCSGGDTIIFSNSWNWTEPYHIKNQLPSSIRSLTHGISIHPPIITSRNQNYGYEFYIYSLGSCEIYNSVEGLFWVGMHCVSSYPCGPDHANLPRLKYLGDLCLNLGYSDHTSDVVTPAISIAYGSCVVEKHFTIDKGLPGRDNKFALDPAEFSQMVENIRNAEKSCFYHGPEPRDIETDTIKHYRGRWGD